MTDHERYFRHRVENARIAREKAAAQFNQTSKVEDWERERAASRHLGRVVRGARAYGYDVDDLMVCDAKGRYGIA